MQNQSSSDDDLYGILGVSPSANNATIKKAFRKLALQQHPDKLPAGSSHEQFAKLQAAYSILRDSNTRKKYDRERNTNPEEVQVIPLGTRVVLHSLVKAVHHNGKVGVVKERVASSGRYRIYLKESDQTVDIKTNNIRIENKYEADTNSNFYNSSRKSTPKRGNGTPPKGRNTTPPSRPAESRQQQQSKYTDFASKRDRSTEGSNGSSGYSSSSFKSNYSSSSGFGNGDSNRTYSSKSSYSSSSGFGKNGSGCYSTKNKNAGPHKTGKQGTSPFGFGSSHDNYQHGSFKTTRTTTTPSVSSKKEHNEGNTYKSNGKANGSKLHTGPRGGRFYYNTASGGKTYVKRSDAGSQVCSSSGRSSPGIINNTYSKGISCTSSCSGNRIYSSSGSANGRTLHRGSRGGTYYMNNGGNKVYVK